MEEKILVGKVVHYYSRISVAVIKVLDTIRVGDEISIEGRTTNLRQRVKSMEIEHKPIREAHPGDLIGLKVDGRVRRNDYVFKVVKTF